MWVPNPEKRAAQQPAQFRMDVSETDKEYQVLAEMPGVKKEDISITINGNEVAVSAEVKREKVVKNDDIAALRRAVLRHGQAPVLARPGGRRSARPGQVQRRRSELTLPKKTAAAAKRLAVH